MYKHRVFKLFGYEFHIHHLTDYMHRWWVKLPNGETRRIHHILRSDNDRHLHNHPWAFTSILLKGSYQEVLPNDIIKDWPQGSIISHEANDLHRLTLKEPVWTFVSTGPKTQEWGFETEQGFVHHLDYLNLDA